MSIRSWPAGERPRERLLRHGAQALSDAELVAILVRNGTRDRDAVAVARGLLASAGSLRALFNQSLAWFQRQSGVGPVAYTMLQAAQELSNRRHSAAADYGSVISSPRDTTGLLSHWLGSLEREVFACLFLDNRHRLMAREILFLGTINSATVHPREVVKRALAHNAAAVILAHNHPSGVAEPSSADRRITRELRDALALVDVRLLDHFVVGEDVVSFSERGLL